MRLASTSSNGSGTDHDPGLSVPDLPAAKAYYDALIGVLGLEEFFGALDQQAWRRTDGKPGTYLFLYAATEPGDHVQGRAGFQHLAFDVHGRRVVRNAHDVATRLGSTVLHPPQPLPQYHEHYYAAFWLDPQGFVLEAVSHKDSE